MRSALLISPYKVLLLENNCIDFNKLFSLLIECEMKILFKKKLLHFNFVPNSQFGMWVSILKRRCKGFLMNKMKQMEASEYTIYVYVLHLM